MDLTKPDFVKKLYRWYETHHRKLPWRRKRAHFYYTLVSEFMLQQTRVDQALPYFHRFIKSFPTLKALAASPLQQVLKQWEGLGYYRRASYLHETARRLQGKNKIVFSDLADCPGIGPYCSAAIGSIVWGKRLPVLDGNVKRVTARLLALRFKPDHPRGKIEIQRLLNKWIEQCERSGIWNQALMELGATVCLPREPRCALCPVANYCAANLRNATRRFPVSKKKPERPTRHALAALIWKNDHFLIARRPNSGLLANLWELPGDFVRQEKPTAVHVQKVLQQKISLNVASVRKTNTIAHVFTHFKMILHIFECSYHNKFCKSFNNSNLRWIKKSEMAQYAFPRAHLKYLDAFVTEQK